jgi:hypothetical protein
MAYGRKNTHAQRHDLIRQITWIPSNLVFMLPRAISVQAMYFFYRLDNEIESQTSDIAENLSLGF